MSGKPVTPAYLAVVESLRALATLRGHILGAEITTEGTFEVAIPCSRCDRWMTISLGASGDRQEVSGRVLGMCRGTKFGPPAAEGFTGSADDAGIL